MKAQIISISIHVSILLISFISATLVHAEDMRSMHLKAQEAVAKLQQKAAAEKKQAIEEAQRARQAIMEHRRLLEERLSQARTRNARLKSEVKKFSAEAESLLKQEKSISAELRQAGQVIHELVGVIRMNAKDISSFVEQNLQSGLFRPDTAFLHRLLQDTRFPGMDDVRAMVELVKAQTVQTGWVTVQNGSMVGRDGRKVSATILLVGPFTAAYRLGDEVGFLSYSSAAREFYAISKLPSASLSRVLNEYMQGQTDDVPVDISRGGAIRELVSTPDLWEQIREGGPVVWPIIGVFVIGLFIIMERIIFLLRSRVNAQELVSAIEGFVSDNRWDLAEEQCRRFGNRPLARVLLAGMQVRTMGREEMENALQEAILGEIPLMERFLSPLGMLAAIAPLLGLLGTVTGMINTFHVITLYGTGDPRMMSAGISEALVTTMLGLTAAIPLLLGHNLLGGVVERRIAEMEEKGVALLNIILKHRKNGGAC